MLAGTDMAASIAAMGLSVPVPPPGPADGPAGPNKSRPPALKSGGRKALPKNPNGEGPAIMLPRPVVPDAAKIAVTNAQAVACFALHDVQPCFQRQTLQRSCIASLVQCSARHASRPPKAPRKPASARLLVRLYSYMKAQNGAPAWAQGAENGFGDKR